MSKLRKRLKSIWSEDSGALTFEWVLLSSLLTFGVVSGIAGARDALIDELGDVSQAMLALDQSYTIDFPLKIQVPIATTSSASDSSFLDAATFVDNQRSDDSDTPVVTQGPVEDDQDQKQTET